MAGRGKEARFASGAALLLIVIAITTIVMSSGPGAIGERTRRFILLGGPLLEVRFPSHGDSVPMGGLPVLVAFPHSGSVAIETFRCLLNEHDVTDQLTVGSNGAAGSLVGLVEGENRLRIEVFGRGWWASRYYEDARTIEIYVRPFPSIDRAEVAPRSRREPTHASLEPAGRTDDVRIA